MFLRSSCSVPEISRLQSAAAMASSCPLPTTPTPRQCPSSRLSIVILIHARSRLPRPRPQRPAGARSSQPDQPSSSTTRPSTNFPSSPTALPGPRRRLCSSRSMRRRTTRTMTCDGPTGRWEERDAVRRVGDRLGRATPFVSPPSPNPASLTIQLTSRLMMRACRNGSSLRTKRTTFTCSLEPTRPFRQARRPHPARRPPHD